MIPTLYEYYSIGPQQNSTSGLEFTSKQFLLNHKPITIIGGSMQYFRVHPVYWRDRLRKMRAAGLNTIMTSVPWTLHEPQSGSFDFGDGKSDFKEFLHLEKFLKTVQEEDLFAIVGVGPYIGSNVEFGGLPTWLLNQDGIRTRRNDDGYMQYVRRYLSRLLSILTLLQFSVGGPIIAFQIEDRYSEFKGFFDKDYLKSLYHILKKKKVVELIFLAEAPSEEAIAQTDSALLKANYTTYPIERTTYLQLFNAPKPLIMKYQLGYLVNHQPQPTDDIIQEDIQNILQEMSIIIDMFIECTSVGFFKGANHQNAAISESGDYTSRYNVISNILNKISSAVIKPIIPKLKFRMAYGTIHVESELGLNEIIVKESYKTNQNSGQHYGYTVYRRTGLDIKSNSSLKIIEPDQDLLLIINNKPLQASEETIYNVGKIIFHFVRGYQNATLDIIFVTALNNTTVVLNGVTIPDFNIIPLEFSKSWIKNLNGWHKPTFKYGPTVYRAILNTNMTTDTYINMRSWSKGVVVINGFVLSRYSKNSTLQTIFLPAPFLKNGENEIIIFELSTPYKFVEFSINPMYAHRKAIFIPKKHSNAANLNFVLEILLVNIYLTNSLHMLDECSVTFMYFFKPE